MYTQSWEFFSNGLNFTLVYISLTFDSISLDIHEYNSLFTLLSLLSICCLSNKLQSSNL